MFHPSLRTRARVVASATVSILALSSWTVPRPCAASEPAAWRLLSESPAFPPAINVPIGVYDPVRHRVLAIDADLFDYDYHQFKVYAFDPAPEPHWSVLATAGEDPGERYLAALVYDPVRDRLVMLGNVTVGTGGLNVRFEVWALTLSGTPAWEKLVTQGVSPDARYGHSAIYDPVNDRVVVFGGVDALAYPEVFHSDVWALSLATNSWTSLVPDGVGPGGREGQGAIYDPARRRMLVFGGHAESNTRVFWNDLWELSLAGSPTWSQITPDGPVPGARSAFGTVYDPVRRRMLIHGGVLADSGIEPDELWALSLDGTPSWARIATQNTLRGRAYPIDVYDPDADRLLACGGGGFPQTSELALADPERWNAVLPTAPLLTPGARSAHAVVYDSRRDRFTVLGGEFSTADSLVWQFSAQDSAPWRPEQSPAPPYVQSQWGYAQATVFDSLGDRFILFNQGRAWSSPANSPQVWSRLGPELQDGNPNPIEGAGVTLDARRNRLLVSGGYIFYPHGDSWTTNAIWALSLGSEPSWSFVGNLPQEYGAAGHATFYDSVNGQLVVLGGEYIPGRFGLRGYGAVVWTTPLDNALHWTESDSTSVCCLPAPPDAPVAFDPGSQRLFMFADTLAYSRALGPTGVWAKMNVSTRSPSIRNPVVYDPARQQLLALFAATPGTDSVEAWAMALGPMQVSSLGVHRSPGEIDLRWQSVTAYGHVAGVERREETTDWVRLGAVDFDARGVGTFVDRAVEPGHDYLYRVSVVGSTGAWYSDPVRVSDPASLRLAMLGARPDPAVGRLQLVFSLPGTGPARLEIFDIRGARCLVRDVGALGPGTHSLAFDESHAWHPGVYYARLQRAGETRIARVVLVQ